MRMQMEVAELRLLIAPSCLNIRPRVLVIFRSALIEVLAEIGLF